MVAPAVAVATCHPTDSSVVSFPPAIKQISRIILGPDVSGMQLFLVPYVAFAISALLQVFFASFNHLEAKCVIGYIWLFTFIQHFPNR
jgi:hypothetical protein